ncbi:hypothetical protein GN244_ATG18314 [Phytophthora infestans]|uniref:Uncharacterized protein n=1 Tax=Phytophthora infestans TaxID=4787 RepID=A0A833W5Y8_PHYIN|nr:hypothetical protein GN244_ATG18313 [Phytophthora infestans]KAF4029932.1 hypothetical protein GN244_ATG18314 [Phytophthora infestans]
MCSVENCTRKCYKATPCCWNHRGHISKFTAIAKPVVESVPEVAVPVVEPVVEPAAELVVEPILEAVAEPVVETVAEAAIVPVVNSVAEAVVEPVVDRNLEYEYNYVHRGRQYEHWIKKHASGVGNVVDGKGKNRRFVWLYSHVDRSAFVKFAHEQLKHECHEVFIGNRKIKFFIDCDQKLTDAEFNAYEMTTDELVLQMATDYMAAFRHALEYIDCNFAIYEDDLDFFVTNRSRKMDNGVKLSTHIVTNIGFTVAECKAIVKYMLRESFTQISDVGDSYIEFLKSCIDLQPYRSNGSLSLPGGTKRGNVNQVIKPFNSTFNTPFLLDTAADMAYTDHDLTNDLEIKTVDKPQEIFAESSNEFIDKAIQKISKIPDYDPSNLDVYGRAPKGNFVYVKRTGPSHCSVCDRIHESDDTMLLIFNEEKQCAWWKCTHAPKETKAIRWFGRGKTEISVDEDAFAPEDIESFAAIAKETAKPQAERKLTEAQRLKLKLIKIVGDKYRRSYGSGAIYELVLEKRI